MPVIRIDYDDEKLDRDEILTLSEAIQKIVSETTKIEDVFVYANSSQIKVKIAPVEIFVQISAHKIEDRDKLIQKIKENKNFYLFFLPITSRHNLMTKSQTRTTSPNPMIQEKIHPPPYPIIPVNPVPVAHPHTIFINPPIIRYKFL